MKTTKQLIEAASKAHSNLTTFGAVIAILEGGCIYGGGNSSRAAWRMIESAKRAMQYELRQHDEAVFALCSSAQNNDAKLPGAQND